MEVYKNMIHLLGYNMQENVSFHKKFANMDKMDLKCLSEPF